MDYPTNLPNDAIAVSIADGKFSPFYDIVWSIKYELLDWTPGDEYGVCFFLKRPGVSNTVIGGGRGPDLGYSGTTSVLAPDVNAVGMVDGILGIGLDTNGAFAAKYTWPGGQERSGLTYTQPNSITLRGGSDDGYQFLNVHLPISAFDLVSSGTKVLRARLGNYGRTIYLDYREASGDTDFVNILTKDVNLNMGRGERLTPGVSFTKPVIASELPGLTIKVDTFHVEGKEGDPDTTFEYPDELIPIECNSIYSGEQIQPKPDVEFDILTPVTNDEEAGSLIMCNPVDPAALSILSSLITPGPYGVGDEVRFSTTITNTSIENQAKRVSLTTSSNIFPKIDISGDTGLVTSSINIDAQQSKTVEFSYKVTLDDIIDSTSKIKATLTATGTNASSTSQSIEAVLEAQRFKFKIDTKRGAANQHVFMSIGKSTGSFGYNNTLLSNDFDDLRIKFVDDNTGAPVYRKLADVPFYLVLPSNVTAVSTSNDWTGNDQVVVPSNFINDSKTYIVDGQADDISSIVGVSNLRSNTIVWVYRYSADNYYKSVTNGAQWQKFVQDCSNNNIRIAYIDEPLDTNWLAWHLINVKENEVNSEVNQFKLPLLDNGVYDFEVDWGDRRTSAVNNNTLSSNPSLHTYFTSGEYIVTIVGQCDGWKFTDNNRLKYINTLDWTGLTLTTPKSFVNCVNYIGSSSTIGTPGIETNLNNTFERCYNLNKDNIQNWDIGGVTNLNSMFSSAYKFNVNLDKWDVGDVTSMENMFNKAFSFNGAVGKWDVNNVSNLNSMFSQAAKFNQNIANWTPNNLATAVSFISGDNMSFSSTNYDKLLNKWGNGSLSAVDVSISIDAVRSENSQSGYNTLVDAGWKISDRGLAT